MGDGLKQKDRRAGDAAELRALARFPEENPNPVLRVTGKGDVVYANPAAQAVDDLFSSADRQRLSRPLVREVTAPGREGMSTKVQVKVGSFNIAFNIVPARDDDSIHLYGNDITEELRLQRQVIDLAKFPSENPLPVLRVSEAGDVLYANEAAIETTALFQGDEASRLAPPLLDDLRACVAGGRRTEVEWASGERVFSLIYTPIAAESYVNIYGRDITIRKRTLADLERAQTWLRAVVDGIPAIINVKDRDGRFVIVNPAQAAFYGAEPVDLVGKTVEEIADPDYAALTRRRDREVMRTGRPLTNFEDPGHDADGELSTWYTTKVPLRAEDDAISGVLTVSLDITVQQPDIGLAAYHIPSEPRARCGDDHIAGLGRPDPPRRPPAVSGRDGRASGRRDRVLFRRVPDPLPRRYLPLGARPRSGAARRDRSGLPHGRFAG
jgi:PAS domain S-box-containing protein